MAGVADLDRARGREQATFLWIRVLAVAAVAFVATTSFQARPAPGGHGQALAVSLLLVAFAGATLAEMWHPAWRDNAWRDDDCGSFNALSDTASDGFRQFGEVHFCRRRRR